VEIESGKITETRISSRVDDMLERTACHGA